MGIQPMRPLPVQWGYFQRVTDDTISAHPGMGGQGILPIPLVYNGWVQNLPAHWSEQLTAAQRNPAQ